MVCKKSVVSSIAVCPFTLSLLLVKTCRAIEQGEIFA